MQGQRSTAGERAERADLRGTTVAVTGATGFLGRYLVDALSAAGARVVGLARRPDRGPALAGPLLELRRADLLDRASLVEGLRGSDAVVAAAALFSLRSQDWHAHLRTNRDGTVHLMRAAREAGVRRVVHVSSVAAYRGRGPGLVDESHPLYPEATRPRRTNVYALSKALAERRAWELASAYGLELCVIRPSVMYGAHDRNFTAAFRRLMRLPVTVFPAGLRLPLVYGGDVAEAIVRALASSGAGPRAYNLAGESRTAWEFARAWRAAGGYGPRVMIPVPVPYRRAFDTSRAQRELAWRPRPWVDGIRATLAAEPWTIGPSLF